MSVKSCEKLDKSKVALTIEADAAAFEAAINKAYLKQRQDQRSRPPPRQGSPQDDREHVRRRGLL